MITPSELYGKCQHLLDLTVGQQPAGPDAPPGFKAMSDQMDQALIDSIASWEVPSGATRDQPLKELITRAKELAAKGLPMREQICSTVADIRKHLYENYTISQ